MPLFPFSHELFVAVFCFFFKQEITFARCYEVEYITRIASTLDAFSFKMSVLLIRLCNVIVSTDPVTLGVIGLVTAVSLRWLYLKTSRKYRLLAKIPGPVPKPIFGNAFDLKGGYDGIIKL